jgi:uncharacterized protein
VGTSAHRIDLGDRAVSATLDRPRGARALFAFAHGAGAGMRHAFMEAMSARLVASGLAVWRYQFPYMEAGQRRPDRAPLLEATARAAIGAAAAAAPDLPLLAGGKSMGGRITSQAAAAAPLPGVRGLIFFGFPLHPARKPAIRRAEHLAAVPLPMLFVQGTRDALADLELIGEVCRGLGDRATLHIADGADHGFQVLVRSGRTGDEVLGEIAGAAAGFADRLLRESGEETGGDDR